MFRCKACPIHEQRIADLKEQIATLKQLVIPASSDVTPIRSLEADAILSGQQHIIEIGESELPKDDTDAEILERDRLFAGTY